MTGIENAAQIDGNARDHDGDHRGGMGDGADIRVIPGGNGSGDAGAGVRRMPGSIVRAISAVKTTVEAVKKSQKNQHGGYMYASADDIYAATSRKMGEVGYHVHALEELCEVKRVEKSAKNGEVVVSQWAHIVYCFLHATESDTWSHPLDRRTLYIQVTGPQTFQAAQSFIEKSYLRSLFKIPTGDMDLDSMPQGETEEDQIALNANGRRPRKTSAEGKRDGSVKVFNEIRADIQGAISADHLQHVRTIRADEWAELPSRWADTLDEEYETKMSDFGTQQAAE